MIEELNEPLKENLLGLDAAGLARFFEAQGEKPFRARQLQRWIHQLGEADFAAMTDLSKALRDKLAETARVAAPAIVGDETTADGEVTAEVVDLAGRRQTVTLRRVSTGDYVDHIGVVRVGAHDTLRVRVGVASDGRRREFDFQRSF